MAAHGDEVASVPVAVNALVAEGGTDIYACAQTLVERLAATREGRTHALAVVLMTDGRSQGDPELFAAFWREAGHGIPVFAITFGDADPQQLETLAELTRGGCSTAGKPRGRIPDRAGLPLNAPADREQPAAARATARRSRLGSPACSARWSVSASGTPALAIGGLIWLGAWALLAPRRRAGEVSAESAATALARTSAGSPARDPPAAGGQRDPLRGTDAGGGCRACRRVAGGAGPRPRRVSSGPRRPQGGGEGGGGGGYAVRAEGLPVPSSGSLRVRRLLGIGAFLAAVGLALLTLWPTGRAAIPWRACCASADRRRLPSWASLAARSWASSTTPRSRRSCATATGLCSMRARRARSRW